MQEFLATINAALTLVCSTMTPVYYGEPVYYEEPTCYEEPAYEQAYEPGEASDFKSQGVVYEDGTTYTWYSENVLPGGGLTKEGGVNYHDGRTETYYSSNVLYHYRTDEWTVDEEGFYRTEDGYYVVAASDMPEGTVFEGSKGECIVLDCGCDAGVTDYYVAWE